MSSKTLVVLCWVQVAIATAFLGLSFYSMWTRPTLQFDYSRTDGHVIDIPPGSTAARDGLLLTDRILAVNGVKVAPGINALYFTRAGDHVPIVVQRGRERLTLQIEAVTLERVRESALRAGGQHALWAVSNYLGMPLNVWMFSLGVMLLVLRSDDRDARLSALSFIYWSGGNFLPQSSGTGATLAVLSPSLRLLIYAVDSFYVAMFFAVCVHFAMVFPRGAGHKLSKPWRLLPYLAVVPIFIEQMSLALRELTPGPAAQKPFISDWYVFLGPSLLVAALVILAVRFRVMSDLNARRRLGLVSLSLLPGALGFVLSVTIDQLDLGRTWMLTGRIINLAGTIAGSSIFAYAVVRHRMFNIRVLIRRSLQYAFARNTLLVLMSLPAVGLAVFLYRHRHQSLDRLLTGTPGLYLLIIAPLFLVIRYRKRLLEALDRRYFREQYDARQLLLHVVSMVRDGSDLFGLSRVALDEVDRALHPKHMSLWQLDPDEREYRRQFARGEHTPSAPPLAAGGTLTLLLGGDEEPLDLHSRHTRPILKRLPEEERKWLHDTDAYLLVPLVIEDRLVGIMHLGERMSEEPYGSEDRELLRTLAAQLALTFDYSRLKASPSLLWTTPQTRTPIPLLEEVRSCSSCGACYGNDHTTCDNDQQALVPESGVPRVIEEKYLVTRLLGRGGMGSVYLANQQRLNRPVAVKVLLQHLVGSASMRNRFEREARIVARLHHPGIVTIHDFGTLPSGHAYLVMEYLDGQTLRKTIAAGPQPHPAMLQIIKPIGEAIEAAHRAGIVHRDLKPENIMIVARRGEDAMTPRVLDFGLAKMTGPLAENEATLVQSGQSIGIVGTLMYIAPEVLGGGTADAKSDQYSLGLIAYELLSGSHPFGGAGDLASIVRGHTQEEPTPIRERAPHVPPHMAAAIHRALAKKAEARFESVSDFMAALAS